MALEEVAAPPETACARSRLSGVVARLAAANLLGAAMGFVTGPLLARSLGAAGRGDLQAVIVPLTVASYALSLGITAYAYRTLPRGRRIDEVLPSLGLPLLVVGLITAAFAVPIADALAGGRETVRTFLIVAFLATPLSLLALLLSSCLAALERWRAVVALTLIPFLVPFVAIVVLFALGHLTVGGAAAATIAGSLLTLVPAMPLVFSVRRPVFRISLAREGITFGLKSWLGGLAQMANARLDQLLMITAVPPRQLGLYAVATTIAEGSGLVTGAISPPLMTRVSSGEIDLMARAVRITVILTIGLNIVFAVATPALILVLFGSDFRAAIPITMVLLVASVPLGAGMVLSTALQADNAPVIPSVAEGIALVITVVGLVTLLPTLQAMGAAIVSVAAYSASFAYQVVVARRRVGVPASEFLVPCREDFRWARDLVLQAVRRLRTAI